MIDQRRLLSEPVCLIFTARTVCVEKLFVSLVQPELLVKDDVLNVVPPGEDDEGPRAA